MSPLSTFEIRRHVWMLNQQQQQVNASVTNSFLKDKNRCTCNVCQDRQFRRTRFLNAWTVRSAPGAFAFQTERDPGADQEPAWCELAVHSRGTTSSRVFEMQWMKASMVWSLYDHPFYAPQMFWWPRETGMHYMKTQCVTISCVSFWRE